MLGCVHRFPTPWTAARRASLSFTISWSLLKLVAIESVMLSNHIILCHPLLLLLLVFPSIRVFPMSQLFASGSRIFSFIISLSNEYSELISFRTDWFDLLGVQVTISLEATKFVNGQNSSRCEKLLQSFSLQCLLTWLLWKKETLKYDE